MSETKFLRPAPGRLVRYPSDGRRLPDEGASVAMDPYWARRLAVGDVIEGEPITQPKPPRRARIKPAAEAGPTTEE